MNSKVPAIIMALGDIQDNERSLQSVILSQIFQLIQGVAG